MAKRQINIRIEDMHLELLDKLVEASNQSGIESNRTNMIQRAIFNFAVEVIGQYNVNDIVNKHLK
jgi:hypothetical protein